MAVQKRTMWAVGPEDDGGWVPIHAPTEAEAVAAYAASEGVNPAYICAHRVPAWDALDRVTKLDWFRAGDGLTHFCDACNEPTSEELGGAIVDGEVLCEDCKPGEEGEDE